MATEADWEAYRTAVVDLDPPGTPGLRLVPDDAGAVGAWPAGLAAPVFVVTAWNPDSVVLDEAENRARHDRLVAELDRRGVAHWPAVGRDTVVVGGAQPMAPAHHEEGVGMTGITRDEALALGRAHGQAAIYAWSPEAWEVVSCTDDRRHVAGWRLERRGGTGSPG